MSGLIRMRLATLILVIATVVSLGAQASAQVSSTTGSGTTSWGNFQWQVDRAPVTTTIIAVAGFFTPSNFFSTTANVASPFTVHEVHGNFALVTWPIWTGDPSSCGNGSIIAQLRDQNNNTIAAVKLQVLGTGTTNVPITGTFSTPLSVTELHLNYFVDLCGAQTVSFSLVMS